MSFEVQISADLKEAMRARQAERLSTLRMLAASLRNAHIAAGRALNDGEAHAVVQKEVKQRQDSIEQFRKGGRDDLAAKESADALEDAATEAKKAAE